MEYCRKTHPDGKAPIFEEPKAIWINWSKGTPKVTARFFGKISLGSMIPSLLDIYPQEIEWGEEIAQWPVNADFVIDRDAGQDQYHRAVEAAIGRIVGAEISLTFRNVEHDAMVLTGTWSEDVGGMSRQIDIYGGKKDEHIWESRSGDLDSFAKRLGTAIGVPVIFETSGAPDKIDWHVRAIKVGTREQAKQSRDPERIIAHVEEQTGLKCFREMRVLRRLFVLTKADA